MKIEKYLMLHVDLFIHWQFIVIWNWFHQQQIDDNEKRTVCGFGSNDERQSNPYTSSNYLTSPTKVEGITDNPISVKAGQATSYVLTGIIIYFN